MPQILGFVVAVFAIITFLASIVPLLCLRVRSRASLELEVIAVRNQTGVLQPQRPGRMRLFFADLSLWIWLYRIWPQAANLLVLVKPTTLLQWHRKASGSRGGGDRQPESDRLGLPGDTHDIPTSHRKHCRCAGASSNRFPVGCKDRVNVRYFGSNSLS
jgi:hypothetical protein